MGRTKFSAEAIKNLPPGKWIWDEGVGCRKNKDGTVGWWIKYFSREFGQQKEALKNCTSVTAARGVLDEKRADIFSGQYIPRKATRAIKWEDYVERFLQVKAALDTAGKYEGQLKNHLTPYFGKKPLKLITRGDCLAYYAKRRKEGAIATANNEMNLVKSFLTAAVDDGHILVNVARGIKLVSANNRVERIFSPMQTKLAFEAAREASKKERAIGHEWLQPLFYVLYFTGLRVTEATLLEWRDIDFERVLFTTRDVKNGHVQTKPMHYVLAAELERWKAEQGVRAGWVFPSSRNTKKRMTKDTVRGNPAEGENKATGWAKLIEIYEAKCREVDIEPGHLTPHDLRRNFTSQFANAGVNTLVIKDLVGHRTLAMTSRYTSMQLDSLREAVHLLPAPGGTQVVQDKLK